MSQGDDRATPNVLGRPGHAARVLKSYDKVACSIVMTLRCSRVLKRGKQTEVIAWYDRKEVKIIEAH